jgi:hypothetical protein
MKKKQKNNKPSKISEVSNKSTISTKKQQAAYKAFLCGTGKTKYEQ